MRPWFRLLIAFGFSAYVSVVVGPSLASGMSFDRATPFRSMANLGRLPLAFEANRGQADASVRFLARGPGYELYLTPAAAVLRLRGAAVGGSEAPSETVVRLWLAGANPQPEVSGVEPLPGITNYFIGSDPIRWRTKVPNYAKVLYRNVYPGIDVVFHGDRRGLEYDFIVAPGADPRRIRFEFEGVRRPAIDSDGALAISTPTGALVQHKPVIYQNVDGVRRYVDGRYVLRGKRRIGFAVASYDRNRPLVIDPVLAYSTYLGGPGDEEQVGGLAVDRVGNVFVVGTNEQGGFPTVPGSLKPEPAGMYRHTFVAKLNAEGTALVYSTYLGGDAGSWGQGIAVDASGSAYVTGHTSFGFPTTPGAFRTSCARTTLDFYVAKLSPTGDSLVYATCLGADAGDELDMAIAVDVRGHAYVTGAVGGGLPTTQRAFQPAHAGGYDAFVTKLDLAGTALVYSTYIGGPGYDAGYGIAVDAAGNAYITGGTSGTLPTTAGVPQSAFGGAVDAFVAKLDSTGSALVYSTFLGGARREEAYGIALDSDGNAYITGGTEGDFPTTPGAAQSSPGGGSTNAFVAKLNSTGSAVIFATYLGGSAGAGGRGIAVDRSGHAYVTGTTNGDFPITTDATQPVRGGAGDAYVAKLNATSGELVFSTYLGGSGYDVGRAIAVDEGQNAYIAGIAGAGFPTTRGAFQTEYAAHGDVFIAKLSNLEYAIEYHHSAFDHYFITALASEVRALDAMPHTGWSRSGRSFLTYGLDTPGTANVCRFWSAQSFAPKSSHFYTPYADECAKVNQDPVWQFEGHAFALRLPEASLGYVTCPSDTRPLYRAFNRGMSGAPNHRYTTDPAVLGEMVAQGWQVEGDLWTRIFACVPAQE